MAQHFAARAADDAAITGGHRQPRSENRKLPPGRFGNQLAQVSGGTSGTSP
jgi:hypothetical protein